MAIVQCWSVQIVIITTSTSLPPWPPQVISCSLIFFGVTLKLSLYRTCHSLTCQHCSDLKEYCWISKGCTIFTPFLRQAISLLSGNQSKVMPVNKPGGSRGEPSWNKLTTANKLQSQRLTSIWSLGPKGWAPGPAGSSKPPKVLPLKITLPTEYTVPAVLWHYVAVHVNLCKWVQDGR